MFLFIILFYFSKEYEFIDGPFTYTIINSTSKEVRIVNCSNITETEIRIPNYVSYQNTNYTIVSISSSTFNLTNINSFKTIYFPYSLRDIGNGTFSGFTNLQKIGYIDQKGEIKNDFLPPNITTLNDTIFYNCIKLKAVQTSGYLKNIGNYAFSNCTSLELFETASINFSIGIGSFAFCTKLTHFNFHQIYLLSDNAFEGCTSLVKVNITKTSIKVIGERAFYNCISLRQVLFSKTVSQISSFAFMNCVKIEEINLLESFIYLQIHNSAFENCVSLVSVIFNMPPFYIGSKAFYSCISLRYVHVLDKSISYLLESMIFEKAFMNCTSLTDFEFNIMPIDIIGNYAFYGCPLKSNIVFLSENLVHKLDIGKHSFSSPLIESIDFGTPKTFSSTFSFILNKDSFSDCKNISCVMVDKSYENKIAVAFSKELINGKNCPNYNNNKKFLFIPLIICGISLVVILVIFLFYILKSKNRQQLNTYPLLNNTTDFNINTIQPDENNTPNIENNEEQENNDPVPNGKQYVTKINVY